MMSLVPKIYILLLKRGVRTKEWLSMIFSGKTFQRNLKSRLYLSRIVNGWVSSNDALTSSPFPVSLLFGAECNREYGTAKLVILDANSALVFIQETMWRRCRCLVARLVSQS